MHAWPALLTLLILCLTLGSACASDSALSSHDAKQPPDAHTDRPGWTLIWADEFDAPADAPPDPDKWTHNLGGHGWGNAELQTYTDRTDNAAHDGQGHLLITAREEIHTGPDGIERPYTSARLVTQNHFTFQYGRVEARIQVPTGQGIWAAFWMLGETFSTAGWPDCGEIDIMEHIGSEPSRTFSALHGPGYSGTDPLGGHHDLPDNQRFTDGFHTFAVEWSPQAIHFEIDGHRYHTRNPADAEPHRWAYDTPMFLILNLAVGGHWPQYPDDTTVFPQTMRIDYVRVYQPQP